MTKRIVCIQCPNGCTLSVDIEGCVVKKVTGAKCPKGVEYAAQEAENPLRILTTTVAAQGLPLKLVPVRTDRPIPKADMLKAMDEIRKMRVTRPLKVGDTVAGDLLGLGVKLVATRAVGRQG